MNKYEAVYFFQLKRGENTLDQVTPEALRGDAEVVLAAVQWGKGLSENLAHATPELRDDSDFALALAKVDSEGRALAYLSERLRDDRDVVMAFVSAWQAGTNLAFASERLKADEVIVRTALRSRGDSLAFVPQSRRGDPELLEIAYASRASALAHLPVAMLQDREFVLDFVTEHRAKEGLLQHLPAQYAQDREVLMQILAHDAASLQFACEGLRDDPEIVLHAMFKPMLNEVPAMGFEFAGAVLRKDKSFLTKVLERLKGYRPDYRKRVTTAIKDAHKLALAAAKGVGAAEVAALKAALRDVRTALKGSSVQRYETDEQTARLAELQPRLQACQDNAALMTAWVEADYLRHPLYCKTRGESLAGISATLMKDRKFLAGLMKVSEGAVLERLSPELQADPEFVLANIGRGTPTESIGPELRKNPSFLAGLIGRLEFLSQVKEIPDPAMWSDRSFVLTMVGLRGGLLECASPALKADREIVLTAFAQNPGSLKHADPSFFKDRAFMEMALKAGSEAAVDGLSEPLISDIEFLVDCVNATDGKFGAMPRRLIARVPRKVRSDKTFLAACLRCNGWGIESVPESLQYDPEVLAAAFASGVPVWKSLDLERLRSAFSKAELKRIVRTQENLDAILGT